jgi:integrase
VEQARGTKGKPKLDANRGWLRLRWTFQKKRYALALGIPDTLTNRALAQQRATIIEADMLSGQFDETLAKYRDIAPTGVPVVELFERFIAYKRREVADPRTLEKYVGLVPHLSRYFRNRQASTLTDLDCFGFRDWLLNKLAPRTVSERLSMLRACWQWAMDRGWVKDSPWKAVKVKVPPKQPAKPFTTQEVKRIIQGFRDSSYYRHYGDFVEFLLSTGCRTGEAIGLQWQHLSDDCDLVWIGQSLSRGKSKSTKTNTARSFALTPTLQIMLQARREAMNPAPDDLVFPAPRGGAIDDHNFRNRAWCRVLKAVNVPYRKPYNTRHTFVSHAIGQGNLPMEVAEVTGHDERTLFKDYLGKTGKGAKLPVLWEQDSDRTT